MPRLAIVCVACVSTVVAAFAAQDPPKKGTADTYTGCLIQGSGPTVFLLDNARADPRRPGEMAQRYKIAIGSSVANTEFARYVNHEVAVVGIAESKQPPPADRIVEEQDLPKIDVRTVALLGDSCAPPN